ncbi:hypothetical protein [Runella sp.]|uniref:nSTAND1 domain-containing NTPase n=1 Tax=Runella sp. TaxID=1960881 RepID=UPI003D0E239C
MVSQERRVKNPFPGLRPFETQESDIFFGRDGLTDTLLKKLRTTRFVAVVGTSGSGKSSLVKAGLLPAMKSGFMVSAGSNWRIAVMRPINNPIFNLAQALFEAQVFPKKSTVQNQAKVIEETLHKSSLGLIDVVQQAEFTNFENLLIVVDQFEELYRFESGNTDQLEQASCFIKLLLEATRNPDLPIYVVLTMRSEYLGKSAQFWGLPEAINNGQFLIPRMNDDERREAIIGPIRIFDAMISSPLVNRLLNDTGDDPDRLPILQHALMRTWDYWTKNRANDNEQIDLQHYENEKVGGMDKALSIHVDEAYHELNEEQQLIAEKIFKRLTETGTGISEGRLPATVNDLMQIAQVEEEVIFPVIDAFRKEGRSFLMPPISNSLQGNTLIDISHESLIRGWDRLKSWAEEESISAKIYLRLVDDAQRYPKGEVNLLTDPELQLALDWYNKNNPNQTWANRYNSDYETAINYLNQSKEQRDIAEKKRIRKQNRNILAAILGVLFFASLFIITFIFYKEAEAGRVEADSQKATAKRSETKSIISRIALKKALEEATYALNKEKIAKKASDSMVLVNKTYAKIGIYYAQAASANQEEDIDQELSNYKKLIQVYKELPQSSYDERMIVNLLIGQALIDDDKTEEGLKYYNQAAALLGKSNKKPDERIKILMNIGGTFLDVEDQLLPEFERKGIQYFEEAATLLRHSTKDSLEKSKIFKEIANALLSDLGRKNSAQIRLNHAVKYYNYAVDISSNSLEKSKKFLELGDKLLASSDSLIMSKSIEYYNRALQINKGNTKLEINQRALNYRKIAVLYSLYDNSTNLKKSIEAYNTAHLLYSNNKDTLQIANTLYDIANVKNRLNSIDSSSNLHSLPDLQNALNMYQKQKTSLYVRMQIVTLIKIGNEYDKTNTLDKALIAYQEAYNVYHKDSITSKSNILNQYNLSMFNAGIALDHIGQIYQKLKSNDLAQKNYQLAYKHLVLSRLVTSNLTPSNNLRQFLLRINSTKDIRLIATTDSEIYSRLSALRKILNISNSSINTYSQENLRE